MREPLVSVITPSYQQARYLEATIRSVLDQDYPRLEYIVLDGGSSDGSAEIVARHADRLAHWESRRDEGQADAIARGWERARGQILAWLNSDDVYLPGAVLRAAQGFAEHPEAVVIYGNCDLVIEPGGEVRPLDVRQTDLVGMLLRRGLIAQPAAFARADAVRRVGGVSRDLHYYMDYDLWLRLLADGPAVYIGGAPLARYRLHPQAKSAARAVELAPEYLRVLDRFYARPYVPPAAIAVRGAAYAQAHLSSARAAYLTRREPRRAVVSALRALRADPSSAVQSLARAAGRLARGVRPPS